MKGIDDNTYNNLLSEINEEKTQFQEDGLYYNPNSIWHGTKYIHGRFDDATLLKLQVADMCDFLEYLFEHSEHCNHITQSDAYEEFEVYQKLNKN